MKKIIFVISLIVLGDSGTVHSAELGDIIYQMAPRASLNWYYQGGGHRPITRANFNRRHRLRLSGAVQLGLGYSCGKFDPAAAIETGMRQIANSADQMLNAAMAQINAIIAAAPMIIIQRADPGLYEFFQAMLARIEGILQFSTRSCEHIPFAQIGTTR